MDLEGFAKRKIIEGWSRGAVIKGLEDLISDFKEWGSNKKTEFSEAVYDEVAVSQGYRTCKDDFIKKVLEYPKSRVSMGTFGVGSRGEGDFKVHRDIADIIGKGNAVIGPREQDDAGVVKSRGGYVTIAVDGIHSRLSEFPFLAGFHAARAALRDVYVMGSRPIALLSDIHLADDGDVGKLYDYTAGVSAVGDLTSVPIVSGSTLRVGGDMVFGDRLVAAVGAVGASESEPLSRMNAKAGDVILLTPGKGGGTIATTAIYSGNFEVVKETLNIDFMCCMDAIFKRDLEKEIHAMTDVTNGGLRGDATEISRSSGTRLVFSEEEVKRSVSPPVLKLLESLGIDSLGVSTDSLMLILPEDAVDKVKQALKHVSPVYEAGYVVAGKGAGMVMDNGKTIELKPLFRESSYTRIKKVMGETSPEGLETLSKALDKAKKESTEKKNRVIEQISKE